VVLDPARGGRRPVGSRRAGARALARAARGALAGDTTDADAETLRRCLRARLEMAVARRLPAGETVGASLSGGVDSSLVVALARRLHDAPLRTYSISFGADYPNELAYSSLVAATTSVVWTTAPNGTFVAPQVFPETGDGPV
jgi:asparagine synthetase B (glutamine-hydrolysing)